MNQTELPPFPINILKMKPNINIFVNYRLVAYLRVYFVPGAEIMSVYAPIKGDQLLLQDTDYFGNTCYL